MAKYVLSAAAAVARARQTNLGYYAPLRPVLIGPRAGLHRYAETTERALIGDYDKLADQTYDYPDRSTGSAIDLDSVLLYASTADLNYFNKYVGSNGSCQPSSTYPNRVRAANYIFKTANDYDRSANFYDRDVAVGDVAYVRGVDGSDTYELTTFVTGFVGETVAATTGAATAEANNAATQSLSTSISQVAGTPINDVVATANGASYASTDDGYITRTYTITVTQSSTGSNATSGRLSVVSADGLDDVASVTPSAFGAATAIGTKGLTVTFAISPSASSACLYGIDEDDFVVGQQWTVTVSQAFTAPTATSGGTYTGTEDHTYVVTVTRGGLYAATTKPQITVTSSTGYDQSGPTNVTAASTAIAVGNYGVTVSFNGTYLRKGDVYYITVTAEAEAQVRTLILQDDIPEEIRGTEVDLRLFVRRTDLAIPTVRTEPTNFTNWSFDNDEITIESGIYIIDDEFTDGSDFVPIAMDSATLYVEYREWVTTGAGAVIVLNDPDDIEANLGTVDPDNPIAYAASMALGNTDGELSGDPTRPAADTTDQVLCIALGGDPSDTDLWTTALEIIEDDEDAYAIVPLTQSATIHALVVAHVTAQSADSSGFYKVAWLPAKLNETAAIVNDTTTDDENPITVTIAEDPDASGEYTIVTASSNATFVTLEVRAGDILRTNYGLDAFGEDTYDEYEIEEVISETTLRLVTGPTAAVSVAVLAEVWREYTRDEMVSQLVANAATYESERIRYVWPDQPGFGGEVVGGESYAGAYLCAALAGLTGAVPSHQSLKNVGLEGFDDMTRSSRYFSQAQLSALADGGVFVVTQTPGGVIYTRNANTTDMSETGTANEMVVRNADMLRKAVQAEWAPYVGAGNVVSNIRQLLESALASLVGNITAASFTEELGPPVGTLTIASLTTVTGQSDVILVTLTATGLAVPLNQIQITLPVSV